MNGHPHRCAAAVSEIGARRPGSEGERPLPRDGDGWDPVPEADSEGALSRLLDVLLDKGVYLHLDLVITVAEVPLIAVDLRATIAGVETMLEWGLPGLWSEGRPAAAAPGAPPAVRAPTVARTPPAGRQEEGVEVRSAMSETRSGSSVWRSGTLLVRPGGTVQWRGDGDRRARLAFDVRDLEAEAVVGSDPSLPGTGVVTLRLSGRSERIASGRAEEIVSLLAGRRSATMGHGRTP
jgi:hypothetical protein